MKPSEAETLAERLLKKRQLLRAGSSAHRKFRTLLFISGGGMRGVYGAGVCLALHHLDLADCFDVVVGISTGAATGGYFLTNEEHARMGVTIYYEECCSGLMNYWPPGMNIDYLENVLRNGKKQLNIAALQAHRSQFLVGVTHWETGAHLLLDAKQALPDPVAAIKASVALTYAYPRPVAVNAAYFTDGGISCPLPLVDAFAMCEPTDVLLISNYENEVHRIVKQTWYEKMLDRLLLLRIPPQLKIKFITRAASWRQSIRLLESAPVHKAILWAHGNASLVTHDKETLRTETLCGIKDTLTLFGDIETSAETLLP